MIDANYYNIKSDFPHKPRQLYVPANGAGDSLRDYGGFLKNKAISAGSPGKVISPYGWASSFNGSSQYFDLGNTSLENFKGGTLAGPHTVLVVARPENNGAQIINSWKNADGENRGWSIRTNSTRLEMQAYDGTAQQTKKTDSTITLGEWYTILAYFPGTPIFTDFYFLVNGVYHTTDGSTGGIGLLANAGWHATIGARKRFATPSVDGYLNGDVALAAYWDNKLPESAALKLSKDPLLLLRRRYGVAGRASIASAQAIKKLEYGQQFGQAVGQL